MGYSHPSCVPSIPNYVHFSNAASPVGEGIAYRCFTHAMCKQEAAVLAALPSATAGLQGRNWAVLCQTLLGEPAGLLLR